MPKESKYPAFTFHQTEAKKRAGGGEGQTNIFMQPCKAKERIQRLSMPKKCFDSSDINHSIHKIIRGTQLLALQQICASQQLFQGKLRQDHWKIVADVRRDKQELILEKAEKVNSVRQAKLDGRQVIRWRLQDKAKDIQKRIQSTTEDQVQCQLDIEQHGHNDSIRPTKSATERKVLRAQTLKQRELVAKALSIMDAREKDTLFNQRINEFIETQRAKSAGLK